MKFAVAILGSAAALALSACDALRAEPEADRPTAAPVATRTAEARAETAPPMLDLPPTAPSASPLAQPVNAADWVAAPPTPQAARDQMIRLQILLDRAHVSPGVIDGKPGENVRNAIAAFERANDLPPDGEADAEVWAKLTQDKGPALTDYVITEADASGPYLAAIPKDYAGMARLERLSYTSPVEALAERFHMDQALLLALNPGADFAAPGTRIVVAAVGPQALPAKVARIDVDKSLKQVRAYDASGRQLAAYPATIGSADLPTPSGEWAVRTVASAPTWTYDPKRLSFGDRAGGKLTVKAGPNNPVGAVWIDLTKDTYGIHGAPEPRLVGKTASHGCVRLTNWDAQQLASSVEKGAKVVFIEVAAASAG